MRKLMLRCLQSKETRIFEVPFDHSIQKLKSLLSYSLFNTPTFASSIRLYIDKDDELSSLSPDDSLLSLGLTFVPLIYYDVSQQQGKSQFEDEKREIKRSPERDLLKRVIMEDLGNDFSNNKLVFAAIHSVFLESGFVAFDSVSKSRISLYDILKNQASVTNFTASVSYTRPQLLYGDNIDLKESSIVLKFHGSRPFKDYVDVSGCLLAKTKYYSRRRLHELKLNIYKIKYVPAIRSFRVKVILEFWKFVKDGLVFPLWINLCEKTGLNLPPCLISLPQELKLKILELLPAQDIAKVACVCKEMKTVCSNNELWKEKFMSKFGSGTTAEGAAESWTSRAFSSSTNWKVRFGSCFESAKKRTANPNPTDDRLSLKFRYSVIPSAFERHR